MHAEKFNLSIILLLYSHILYAMVVIGRINAFDVTLLSTAIHAYCAAFSTAHLAIVIHTYCTKHNVQHSTTIVQLENNTTSKLFSCQ